jgi:hypothetical protein
LRPPCLLKIGAGAHIATMSCEFLDKLKGLGESFEASYDLKAHIGFTILFLIAVGVRVVALSNFQESIYGGDMGLRGFGGHSISLPVKRF